MSRGHVEYLDLTKLEADSYAFGGITSGLRGRIVSRDLQTQAHTAYLHAAPFWCWRVPGYFVKDIEILVLSGALRVGAKTLNTGSYAFVAAGEHLTTIESASGCSMLWMSDSDSAFVDSDRNARELDERRMVPAIDAHSLPWTMAPAFEGRTVEETVEGLSIKWLREDPRTSAYTLLSRHAPGWADPRLEAHDTWEELLLLDGDYLMGDTGVIAAGSYIFRPGERPHGPQATRGGAVWFCRGERRIDFDLTSPEWAAERANSYVNSAANRTAQPNFKPWGNWL